MLSNIKYFFKTLLIYFGFCLGAFFSSNISSILFFNYLHNVDVRLRNTFILLLLSIIGIVIGVNIDMIFYYLICMAVLSYLFYLDIKYYNRSIAFIFISMIFLFLFGILINGSINLYATIPIIDNNNSIFYNSYIPLMALTLMMYIIFYINYAVYIVLREFVCSIFISFLFCTTTVVFSYNKIFLVYFTCTNCTSTNIEELWGGFYTNIDNVLFLFIVVFYIVFLLLYRGILKTQLVLFGVILLPFVYFLKLWIIGYLYLLLILYLLSLNFKYKFIFVLYIINNVFSLFCMDQFDWNIIGFINTIVIIVLTIVYVYYMMSLLIEDEMVLYFYLFDLNTIFYRKYLVSIYIIGVMISLVLLILWGYFVFVKSVLILMGLLLLLNYVIICQKNLDKNLQ